MKKLPISVCIIAGAEAHRIRRTLASVADWCAEIVAVVNEDVADGTDRIAMDFGAMTFREPWKGFLGQKNSVAQKASQPWLLGLDADEVVPGELRLEIEELFGDPSKLASHAAYNFPRCTFYCGRWIRHGDWYPDRVTRLWKKDCARWEGIEPHAALEVKGPVGRLRNDLLHFSNESIDSQVAKIASYSDYFVKHGIANRRSASAVDLAVRPLWRFVRAYFFKLGFLDGWPGYYIAWVNAFSTVTRYAKLREARLPAQNQK
jgi:glycosyltransferase involved in cell wall biosynthesis